MPYQGPDTPDEDLTYRSARLKKWALGIGQQERARLRELPNLPPALDPPRPRPDTDEIARERGVIRLLERGGRISELAMDSRAYIYSRRPSRKSPARQLGLDVQSTDSTAYFRSRQPDMRPE